MLRNVQKQRFSVEFDALQNGECLSRDSCILSLDPKLDATTNLLVVGGRLDFSELSEETKHQIILPNNDSLVEKMIMHYHVTNHHAPIETTLCIIRQKFWIIHGRREVSKVIHKCLKCKHLSTSSSEQKMGPLPPQRTSVAPAFTNVGLDFTGPLMVRTENVIHKAYICLFTCMQSRMVHLELTLSMNTEEFLSAFRRMLNRRGMCRFVCSDNFGSFKKAFKVIKSLETNNFCNEKGIEWKFITEQSPFRGGFYERLNRSLKKPLKAVLGKALLTFSEMCTVLTDIECSLNQRPLTFQGTDPRDLQPITPAHLSLGRPLCSLPDTFNENIPTHKRYRYLQDLQDHFWKRWTKEVLPVLQTRQKWKTEHSNIKVNDVCLIVDEKLKRSKWPLARVIELIPGRDGLIRTLKLKTEKGTCVRPVQKVHLFESYYS